MLRDIDQSSARSETLISWEENLNPKPHDGDCLHGAALMLCLLHACCHEVKVSPFQQSVGAS